MNGITKELVDVSQRRKTSHWLTFYGFSLSFSFLTLSLFLPLSLFLSLPFYVNFLFVLWLELRLDSEV